MPLRLYGDGADATQHFELMTLLPCLCCSSSTLDSRIAISIRNSNKTTVEARHKILEVLAWSFEALRIWDLISFTFFYCGIFWLKPIISSDDPRIYDPHPNPELLPFTKLHRQYSGRGEHPHQDPWGEPFTEAYYPERKLLAGSRLSGRYNYVLDGIQGDADFVAALFSLNRILAI